MFPSPPAMSPIEMYARLLMTVPVVLAIFVLAVVGILIGISWARWNRKQKQAKREAHAMKYRPDGVPYPPTGRGMCDCCERASEKVYFMDDGTRACPECYESRDTGKGA